MERLSIRGNRRHGSFRVWCITVAPLLLIISLPSSASLGGTVDSIQLDQTQMSATLTVTQGSSYSVYELTTPTRIVVREYVSPAGLVFGITWQGAFVPSMQQLLGSYFDAYSQAANAQRQSHVERRPLNIQQSGLVVRTAGHMRAYFGRAYVPALLPSGVNADDVR